MGWFAQLSKNRKQKLVMAIVFIVMGAILESLQYLNPVRQFGIDDMLANFLGVLLALLITRGPLLKIFHYSERFILRIKHTDI